MYMMCQIEIDHFKDIDDDIDFCKKLLAEESVFFLPSSCFFAKNMFRIVICNREEKFTEMGTRLDEFCKRHAK